MAKLGTKPGRARPYPNEFRLPCIIHNKYFYYTHIRWAVPVDEHTTRNFQVYAGEYQGSRSLAFSAHYWLFHRWVFHMLFNGQDEKVVEVLDWDAPERLYPPDRSLTDLRRFIETEARASDPMASNGHAARTGRPRGRDGGARSRDEREMRGIHCPLPRRGGGVECGGRR